MQTTKPNEFIILRIPSIKENISFIYQTFGITQYLFYDDRFSIPEIKDKCPHNFEQEYYEEFREKCLEIKKDKEISFSISEFIFFAKVIDFVSKCYIGDANSKLKEIIESDFIDSPAFKYNSYREQYLKKSSNLFHDFKENCKNKLILEELKTELNWQIDI